MTVRKLVLEDFFEEEQWTLVAIYCNTEDYRLAYLINKHIKSNFKRLPTDIKVSEASNFSIFKWDNIKELSKWYLVSNISKTQVENSNTTSITLFSKQNNVVETQVLLPEYKKVNFILKIDNQVADKKALIHKLQKIPQIITAFNIEADNLKSKHNLIF